MLYITTLNDKDAYTAHRTLRSDCAPDTGEFVPFYLPAFEQEYIQSLAEKGTGQIVADVMNLFFSCGLTGWDVDFCIGKNPVKLKTMNHKIVISETWYNHEDKYKYIENALYARICPNNERAGKPTEWFRVAVRVAVMFATYSELLKQNVVTADQLFDVAVPVGDFTAPISAFYAGKMGLPVGTTVCSCDDSNNIWDLVQRGEVNPGVCTYQKGIERLLQGLYGCDEVHRYRQSYETGAGYHFEEEDFSKLDGLVFAAVIGKDRIPSVINSMFKTSDYLIDECTAYAYAGLQDFRTRIANGRPGLLFALNNPALSFEQISAATGVSKDQLKKR